MKNFCFTIACVRRFHEIHVLYQIPMTEREETLSEERASSITHGLGILFSLVVIPILIFAAYEKSVASTIWAVAVFGFGLLMVYTSSTLYHAARETRTKHLLRIWDHISIFVLIAGTYTPMVIKYTDRATCIVFLTVMWTIVIAGSCMKIFYTGKNKVFSVSLYLALGWMALFIIKPLAANMPLPVMGWAVAGGLAYTLGVVFYLWKNLQYHHAVWHLFVLTGSVTHFFAVYNSIPINIK